MMMLLSLLNVARLFSFGLFFLYLAFVLCSYHEYPVIFCCFLQRWFCCGVLLGAEDASYVIMDDVRMMMYEWMGDTPLRKRVWWGAGGY